MVKYLVEFNSAEEVTTDGWKEMFELVNAQGKEIVNVYKLDGENKIECDWIQNRLETIRTGKNPKKAAAKSKWSADCRKAIKELEVVGYFKTTEKSLYEEIKNYCKENKVAAKGRWAGKSYKIEMK